jgi:hypothetical protein
VDEGLMTARWRIELLGRLRVVPEVGQESRYALDEVTNPAAIATDVAAFDAALRAAEREASAAEQARLLSQLGS